MFNDAPDPARCKFSTRGWSFKPSLPLPLSLSLSLLWCGTTALALSFLSYDSHSYAVSRRQPLIHLPCTFFPCAPPTLPLRGDTGTHFSVIRYSFLIFYRSLVYFPVSSFSIVRPRRDEGEIAASREDGRRMVYPSNNRISLLVVKNITPSLPIFSFFHSLTFFNSFNVSFESLSVLAAMGSTLGTLKHLVHACSWK